jgi:hypothetical protein
VLSLPALSHSGAHLGPHISPPSLTRFPVLRERAYRRFWYAALAHNVGGWLLFAAQGWLLLGLTDQPRVVALFLALRLAPKALLGLPAGALCDRYGALPVLRAARFADVLPAVLITGAVLAGQLSVGIVLGSAALAAAIQAFDQPAHRSLIHLYAPGDLLVGGVALSAMAATLATLLGPLLLVLVAAPAGVVWAFPLQALLTGLSGVILLGTWDGCRPARRAVHAVRVNCWAALCSLAATPPLLVLIVLAGAPGLLDRLLALATPGYAAGQGGGAAGMTLLFLAPATGALLGGALLATLDGAVRRLLPLALGSSSVAMVSVSLLATTRLFVAVVLLCLLLGMAKAVFSITVMTALQRRVPDYARGRLLAF